jgi:hypothetical protein
MAAQRLINYDPFKDTRRAVVCGTHCPATQSFKRYTAAGNAGGCRPFPCHFTDRSGFLGVEIAEFNPLNDHEQRTLQVIGRLLAPLLPRH